MSLPIDIPNPSKPLFPDGLTKAGLAGYYARVADVMLPHVRGRPVHMQRFPDGIEGEQIQQKQAPDYFPAFVGRAEVPRRRGGSVRHVVIENAETLVYLVGQACITPHVWTSRAPRLDAPDQLVFDLDPDGPDFAAVRDAAHAVRDLLTELELAAYLKLTGSRGVHVVSPLRPGPSHDDVKAFAQAAAGLLARRAPDRLTAEFRKAKRDGRLYVDVARNGYAQTVVAPYAVRALPGAPVACPIDWRELGRGGPQRFTVASTPRRLAQRADPWEGFAADARPLAGAARRLVRLV
jgi:bifunctional non-homologous end joining protein LigD